MAALCLWMTLALGAPAAPDGTLLFLENSNLFVELYTGSDTTHVAIVMTEGDESWVYEATPHEVRKLKLAAYYEELALLNDRRGKKSQIRVTMAPPKQAYSAEQVAKMRAYLETQLERRYSIKGYVRGESDGIHCAELAARTLCSAGVLSIERCQDQSPAALLAKMKPLSSSLSTVAITAPVQQQGWCERSWERWSSFGNWCQWSCWEAWTFCW